MQKKIKSIIAHNAFNVRGWKTKKKILVFESDDWGSIRMPSKDTYNHILSKGIDIDKCPYNRFDSLATEEDLTSLFDVLHTHKDKSGNHPIFTANTIVANPDFAKIKASDFESYFFEPFTETLDKYPNCKNSFKIWQQGINEKIFKPQLHGREHINIKRWMDILKNQERYPITQLAFENNFYGINATIAKENRQNYMPALDIDNVSDIQSAEKIIKDSSLLFKKLFGYNSISFIAPSYTWHPAHEAILNKTGIRVLQGNPFQKIPNTTRKPKLKYKYKYHYTGQKNSQGLIYLSRNCYFEPSQHNKEDAIESCLKRIEIAFRWNKPAIIGSHRLNYIGSIDEKNRDINLQKLNSLLTRILNKWPQIEFMSSCELGNHILKYNEKDYHL